MQLFDYRAVDKSGKRVKGSIDAETPRDARVRLRSKGLFPIEVQAQARPEEASTGIWFGRISIKDLSSSMRQLAVLIGSGLTLVESLSAVVEEEEGSKLGKVFALVKSHVVAGSNLAEAMERYQKVFPEVAVNMIRSAEASGALPVVLERLADLLEGRVRLTSKVKAAMAYPIFMFLVGALILVFLFSYVIPTVTTLFDQTGLILPLPTRMLIVMSDFVRNFGLYILALLIAVIILFKKLSALKPVSRFFDRIKINMPITGIVIKKLILARFSRTMATLLSSGVTVTDSLAITAKIAGNALYRDSLELAREKIIAGAAFAGQLKPVRLWPPTVVRMVGVGERSARLSEIFDRLAVNIENEVESSITGLLSLLEPFMILIMGTIVGFIVLSILLPIFDMTRLVG